jgi:hypothetical protein
MWKSLVRELGHLYREDAWSQTISEQQIARLTDTLFTRVKAKALENKQNCSIFKDVKEFNGCIKPSLSNLFKMTPLILDNNGISLRDIYRRCVNPNAKNMPTYLVKRIDFLFESPDLNKLKRKIKSKEEYLKFYQNLAQERDGELLSKEYNNAKTKLHWKCNKCVYDWWATPESVKDRPSQKGRWCPRCSQRLKLTIEDMQKLAESRGGWCLSKKYINNKTKLKWKCGVCGNIWQASSKSVKSLNSWCSQCAENLYERMCRAMFEAIFNIKFPKVYHKWLKSKNGGQMHLDGYNEELKLAFEYQGRQHYEYTPYFHKTKKRFEEKKALDDLKRKLCKDHGITLIELGWIYKEGRLRKVKFNEMEGYIRKKCCENKIIPPKKHKKIQWRTLNVAPPDKLLEMHKLAESRGGSCLSNEYLGTHVKLKWQCGKCKKEWWATPHNIISASSWCPKCGVEKSARKRTKYTIRDMQKLAASKGGLCLSSFYLGMMTKLEWKCAYGHIWEAVPNNIKNHGNWCPKCHGRND